MSKYEDPILKRLKGLLNEYGPPELRGRWSVGDSLNLPASALPRGFVSYDTERFTDISNADLRDNCNIVITVAVDMKREFEVPTDRSESHEQVVGYLCPKDEQLRISPDGVLGCLRKYQDLYSSENLWIQTEGDTEVDYGLGIEKRGPGIMTAEGKIRVTLTSDQRKPGYYS